MCQMTFNCKQRHFKIELTQGKFAIVDEQDFEVVNQFLWFVRIDGKLLYAGRNFGHGRNRRQIKLHQQLMGYRKGFEVDHRDGNGLNNCRKNLRWATRSQNTHNGKDRKRLNRYKGVWRDPRYNLTKPWQARIWRDYKCIHLGNFKTEEEAALAYNEAAITLFKGFAKLNELNA